MDPKELTPEKIREILEKKSYQDLIGVLETDKVEFKGQPYLLENESQKQELSKDVTGLANSKGGVIIIGVKTEKNLLIPHDQVVEISPFPPLTTPSTNLTEQYENILKTWVFPSIDFEVKLYRVGEASQPDSSPKFILAIFIPEQKKEQRPFLIVRYFDEKNEKKSEIVFGYAERRGSGVTPMTVSELHRLINRGIFSDDVINSKFDVILDLLSTQSGLQEENQIMEKHIKDSLTALDRADNPVILLGVFPSEEVQIPTLFQSRESEIVQLLTNPPSLRNLGFDLRVGSFPAIREGQVRRALAPRGKILDLRRDGSLIFGAAGDGNFLCWGNANETTLTINPLALIESTYLFIELSQEVFRKFATPRPTKAIFMLSLRNPPQGDLQQGYNVEKPYNLLAGNWGSFRTAPEPSKDFRVECLLEKYNFYTDEESSGRIAFGLLRELYTWFGIEENLIPYTEDTEKGSRISREMIIKGESRPTFPPPIQ